MTKIVSVLKRVQWWVILVLAMVVAGIVLFSLGYSVGPAFILGAIPVAILVRG